MEPMFVRPRDGLVLRMPDGGTLPAEGAAVPRDLFWLRRIADGDVVEGAPAKPARASKGDSA